MEAGNITLTLLGFQEGHRQCERNDLCIAIVLDNIYLLTVLYIVAKMIAFCHLLGQSIAFCLRAHEITMVMILSSPHRFLCLHASKTPGLWTYFHRPQYR